jgi:GrpB-like predicted nucleotidyltransferase (UPF0157 family)
MLGLHKDKVELFSYNEAWKLEFEREKEILSNILKDNALDIQHIGSTAIPGLCAKPIIDVAVAVANLEKLKELIPLMLSSGYDVLDSIETKGEILARKGSSECRTHYIHIEVINSEYWKNHILFRDYLLKYPENIKLYEQIKQKFAADYKDDRKKYTEEKNAFIKNILKLAEQEFKKQ